MPGKKTGLLCVTLIFASGCWLSLDPPQNREILFALFILCHICLFLLTNIATAWSVSTTLPLSRYRALGTALVQLVHLLVLFVPHIFATNASLLVIVTIASAICLWGVMRYKSLHLYHKGSHIETRFTHGVSLASSITFILACVIGLNGEQILDASLKINLRTAHWEGDKYPIALNHLITASSRLLAFGMSSSISNPVSLMGIWTTTQILRLILMGAHADLSSLWVTGGLIVLDKWSGTLGEIALETALLHRLSEAPRGIFPAIYLMSLYQPLEDITGSAVKIIVRGAKSAEAGTILNLFQEYKGFIVAAMVVTTFVFVTRWSQTSPQPETPKDKKK